jgi:16S rRNA C1402 N4-methylase RsmH
MSFVLHEVENKKEMLANIHAALKEGGRIAIIEFKRNVRSFGPPNHERIGEDELKKLLEEAGFTDISIQSLRRSTYLATAVKA